MRSTEKTTTTERAEIQKSMLQKSGCGHFRETSMQTVELGDSVESKFDSIRFYSIQFDSLLLHHSRIRL